MYKVKQANKAIALSAIATGLLGWGSASAIQYYNVTQVEAEGQVSNATLSTATINDAIFTTNITPQQIVGTGVFNPFVRIQHLGSANCANNDSCVEYGYNTDGGVTPNPGPGSANKAQFNTKDQEGTNWNHSLTLNSIGSEKIGTTTYLTFVLDINERMGGSKNDEYLSLDQFRLFVSNDGNLDNYQFNSGAQTSGPAGDSTYSPLNDTLGSATRIFDMDQLLQGANCTAGGTTGDPNNSTPELAGVCDRTVGLNYALNSGSGNGIDLLVRVPEALFYTNYGQANQAAIGNYVYLFSSFGELGLNANNGTNDNKPASNLPAGDFGASAGFEEWSTLKKTPIAPTLALLLGGFAAMSAIRRLRPAPRFA